MLSDRPRALFFRLRFGRRLLPFDNRITSPEGKDLHFTGPLLSPAGPPKIFYHMKNGAPGGWAPRGAIAFQLLDYSELPEYNLKQSHNQMQKGHEA